MSKHWQINRPYIHMQGWILLKKGKNTINLGFKRLPTLASVQHQAHKYELYPSLWIYQRYRSACPYKSCNSAQPHLTFTDTICTIKVQLMRESLSWVVLIFVWSMFVWLLITNFIWICIRKKLYLQIRKRVPTGPGKLLIIFIFKLHFSSCSDLQNDKNLFFTIK